MIEIVTGHENQWYQDGNDPAADHPVRFLVSSSLNKAVEDKYQNPHAHERFWCFYEGEHSKESEEKLQWQAQAAGRIGCEQAIVKEENDCHVGHEQAKDQKELGILVRIDLFLKDNKQDNK